MANVKSEDPSDSTNGAGVISRRLFSKGAAAATTAAATVAFSATSASAETSASTETSAPAGASASRKALRIDPRPSRSRADHLESPELEALVSHWQHLESRTLRVSQVTRVKAHRGAIAVLFDGPAGTFQVDVLRRDGAGPEGVAERGQLSFFLANRGDGGTTTNEEHGLTLMALSELPEFSMNAPAGLLSWQERRATFPGGAFLLT